MKLSKLAKIEKFINIMKHISKLVIWMGWWGRGMGGWRGPYPGNGPWGYLPPWERPGWKYGRGWCWWYLGTPSAAPPAVAAPWIDRTAELKYLEDLKKKIDERIEELKKSMQESST
ncbi:MAG: hypothetical protein ACP5HH_05180 [Fervidicoccaceae archaeon]